MQIGGESIAAHLIRLLDTPGYFMGLNGVILLAYLLAIPANEVVIPTVLMLTTLIIGSAGGDAGVLMEGGDAETFRYPAEWWLDAHDGCLYDALLPPAPPL